LIVNALDSKHATCSLTIESAEDLWTLRRLVAKGDIVVTRSSRIVKRETEYSRPDKGERIKLTLSLQVEQIHLDSSIERIRIRGKILEASDETVTKSGSHAVTVTPGHSITIRKQSWGNFETSLIHKGEEISARYLLITADRREAGIGTLVGSHLTILTSIESGLGGKMSEEASSKPFVAKIAEVVSQTAGNEDLVVVSGPGNFKNLIANQIREKTTSKVTIVEGFDLTGSDGIRALVKDASFQAVAQGSLLVEMQKLVGEVVRRIAIGDPKVTYTLPRVAQAAQAGAVESCVVSDDVFSMGVDEESLVSVLNLIESKGGRVYLADHSLELGKQVSSFGGIVALTRYAVTSY